MKLLKILLLLGIAVTASSAFAQPVWNIMWGPSGGTGIPLGPMTSITIALLLGLTAVHFLRKRSSGVASLMIAAALVVGVYGYSIDGAISNMGYDLTINARSGNSTLPCPVSGNSPLSVFNNYAGPVVLTSVVPSTAVIPLNTTNCESGYLLSPATMCGLSCEPAMAPE